jgi:hypothetical protein
MENNNDYKNKGWEMMSNRLDIEMPIKENKERKLLLVYLCVFLLMFSYLGYQIFSLKSANKKLSNEVINMNYAAANNFIQKHLEVENIKENSITSESQSIRKPVPQPLVQKRNLNTIHSEFSPLASTRVEGSEMNNSELTPLTSTIVEGNEMNNSEFMVLNNEDDKIISENSTETGSITRSNIDPISTINILSTKNLDYTFHPKFVQSIKNKDDNSSDVTYASSANYLSSINDYSGLNIGFEVQKKLLNRLNASIGFNFTSLNYQGVHSNEITKLDSENSNLNLTTNNKYIGIHFDLNYYVSNKFYLKSGMLCGIKTNHQDTYAENVTVSYITDPNSIGLTGFSKLQVNSPTSETSLGQYAAVFGMGYDFTNHLALQSSFNYYFTNHFEESKYKLFSLGLKYKF